MRHRIAALLSLPCVRLPGNGPPVSYLRRGGAPGRLPTLAAIARAVGILESPAVETALLDVLARFVDRTRWTRGEIPAGAVRGGLPPGVVQHDPWCGTLADRSTGDRERSRWVVEETGLASQRRHSVACPPSWFGPF